MTIANRTSATFAALLTTCLLGAQGARAQDVGDPVKGQAFARGACAECHAVLSDEIVSPRFNIASFKRIANTPGMNAQALSIWLISSHPSMPNLILEIEDRRNVVAYIESLKDK